MITCPVCGYQIPTSHSISHILNCDKAEGQLFDEWYQSTIPHDWMTSEQYRDYSFDQSLIEAEQAWERMMEYRACMSGYAEEHRYAY